MSAKCKFWFFIFLSPDDDDDDDTVDGAFAFKKRGNYYFT